jgi:hypothetical protein
VRDLKTLLSSDATDFERQLLGAAAGERPSPELLLRMQQAIALGPQAARAPDASSGGSEIAGTPVAVKAASRWAAGTWLKVVLGVGAGAGLVGGGLAIRSSDPAPLARVSSPAPQQLPPAAPVEAPTVNPPGAAMSRELREEIDLLDRVSTALNQGDVRAASALLENYAHRFPEGRLVREATLLRARTAQVARTSR